MKKINLDLQFKTLTGQLVVASNENKQPLILKMVLLNILGIYQAPNGEESIKVYDIGIRINQAKNNIELEDSDFELIKKVVDSNKLFTSIITAQILKYFKKLEEVKTGDK